MVFAVFISLTGTTVLSSRHSKEQTRIERGQAVYISEGCIHCHSQYSRPGTKDTIYWGAGSTLPQEGNGPVLIGNRRQGPDLSNVGTRRTRDWNRRHLIQPDVLTPGSRMPSYEHLFDRQAFGKGEALLDYLESLTNNDSTRLLGDLDNL